MRKKTIIWCVVDGIIFLSILGMLIVVCLQVLSRMINSSIPWTEELTRNFFIWTVNFGMAVGFRSVEHARVTFIFDLLPYKKFFRKVQGFIYLISCLAFFVIVMYYNCGMTHRQYCSLESSPSLGIPMFYVTLPLGVCSLLSIIAIFQSYFLDSNTKRLITTDVSTEELEENKL